MSFDQLVKDVDEIKQTVQAIGIVQSLDHEMLLKHDKYLVTGNGVPSLQETVRVLSTTLSGFIDDVKDERKKRVEREEKEVELKRVERNKWKWTLIGVCITTIPPVFIQAVYFWMKLVPLIEQKQTLP